MAWDDKVYLEDIQAEIHKFTNYSAGMTPGDSSIDPRIKDVLIQSFIGICNSVNNFPADFRGRYPEVPWERIVKWPTLLTNRFQDLDLQVVWDFSLKELPWLERRVALILKGRADTL